MTILIKIILPMNHYKLYRIFPYGCYFSVAHLKNNNNKCWHYLTNSFLSILFCVFETTIYLRGRIIQKGLSAKNRRFFSPHFIPKCVFTVAEPFQERGKLNLFQDIYKTKQKRVAILYMKYLFFKKKSNSQLLQGFIQ